MKLVIFSCGLLFLGAFQHFTAGAPTEDLVASALDAEVPSASGIKRDLTAVQAAVENGDHQGESLVDAEDVASREKRTLGLLSLLHHKHKHYKPSVRKHKTSEYRNSRDYGYHHKLFKFKLPYLFNIFRPYKTCCAKKRVYNVSRGHGKSSKGNRRKGGSVYRKRKPHKPHKPHKPVPVRVPDYHEEPPQTYTPNVEIENTYDDVNPYSEHTEVTHVEEPETGPYDAHNPETDPPYD